MSLRWPQREKERTRGWREGLISVDARAHGHYTGLELYRHKNVMKRLRTGRGQQMARKIKENGNNGERTTGQANIFVFLHGEVAIHPMCHTARQRSVYYFTRRPGFAQTFIRVRGYSNKSADCGISRVIVRVSSARLFFYLSEEARDLRKLLELEDRVGRKCRVLGEKILCTWNCCNFVLKCEASALTARYVLVSKILSCKKRG